MSAADEEVVFEDARILWRNFAGEEKTFNAAGARNFNLVLDDETAERMLKEGWNVKKTKPKEEGVEPINVLKVSVNFKSRNKPRLIMISSRGRTTLDESTAEMLDYAEIDKVDLIIRPYDWLVNGNTGRKAYLKSIYVTIHEDPLELKYADVQEVGYGDSYEPEEEFD